MRQQTWKAIAVAVLAAAPLITGCDRGQQGPPQQQAPEVAVVTVAPQRLVLTTELPGRASAYRVSEVRPQVSGLIQKRLFTEGAEVKAGDVLYHIDAAPFQAAYNSALASLDASKKAADRARAAETAAIANVARQEATLSLANTNLQRMESLYSERAVAQGELDRARTDVQVAQAALQAVQAEVESSRAAIAAAEAAVKQAEATVESSKINLSYTKIVAPISGRIGASNVTEGAAVVAYQPLSLATITQLDPIYVDVPQSTSEMNRLKSGLASGELEQNAELKNVELRIADGSGYRLTGKLQFRDVTVDSTTGSVSLRIVAPNPEGVLLPGMFVRAIIPQAVHEEAILVPQQAVTRDARGSAYVMIVDGEGKVQQRKIDAARAVGDKWHVTSGLENGDRVITEGLQTVARVPPGTPVRIATTPAGPTNGAGAGAATQPSASAK